MSIFYSAKFTPLKDDTSFESCIFSLQLILFMIQSSMQDGVLT